MSDTMPQLAFRAPTITDAGAISALIGSTWAEFYAYSVSPSDLATYLAGPLSPASIEKDILDPCMRFVLALRPTPTPEDAGEIVGVAQMVIGTIESCLTLPKAIELRRFYVKSAYHGSGLAKSLMQRAEGLARSQGYESMWLGVWDENGRGRRFYEKVGYEMRGEHWFFVGESKRRDWVMEKPL